MCVCESVRVCMSVSVSVCVCVGGGILAITRVSKNHGNTGLSRIGERSGSSPTYGATPRFYGND